MMKLPRSIRAVVSVKISPMEAEATLGVGLSVIDLLWIGLARSGGWHVATRRLPRLVAGLAEVTGPVAAWALAVTGFAVAALLVAVVILPFLVLHADAWMGPLATLVMGVTGANYRSAWVEFEFYRNFLNSLMITAGVVTVSLTGGSLAGFGLARCRARVAFWILIAALVFRALPHSVLVAGYLPAFIKSSEILAPILGEAAPTLYGMPLPVIFVLVAINKPLTIWLLRSYFANIPPELDEVARVDGCTYIQAFRLVIVPVMWPGVITAGLFSFLLGYNDYLVTSLLLDAQNQTMVPGIASFFNRETTSTDQVRAVAAAVSITAPLFLLVMVFPKQIVSILTAGAVKG
jgi:multiple sugar transport system permease protein